MLVVRLGAAFDEEGWTGTLPFTDPDFEFHEPPEQPGATVFHGHEEARAGWAGWAETWVDQRSEVRDVRELSDGRIFVRAHQWLRGRDEIEVEQDAWALFSFKGGKVIRWEVYWSEANALAAAGLTD